jgi:hypothetical protein
MKREYLIAIGIVAVALVMCGCAAGAAFVLWPKSSAGPPGSEASGQYDRMLEYGADECLGTWRCVSDGSEVKSGSTIEFVAENGHWSAFWSTDPSSGKAIEFHFRLAEHDTFSSGKGHLELVQAQIPQGSQGYVFRFHIDSQDGQIDLYTDTDGYPYGTPAVLERVR